VMDTESELQVRSRWWTYRRQRLGRAAPSLEEALHDIVAVYSSHPSAPLSLRARAKSFSPDDFRSLERDHRAVRIPAMRKSVFLMACEDAVTAFAATRTTLEQNLPRLSYANTTLDEYPQLKAAILSAATKPMTPEQLRDVIGDENEQRVTTLARIIATEGELLRVGAESLRSNNICYVSTSSWEPRLLDERGRDSDEALNVLARRYLSAFGPARVKDFQWWIGTTKTRAAAALASIDTVTLADGSLLLAEDLPEFECVMPPPAHSVDILPKWDSYTMGYAPDGRARFVSSDMQSRVYINVGDGLGVVLVEGKAVGAWSSSFSGKRLDVTLDMFDLSAEPHLQAIHDQFEEIAQVLGGTTCTVKSSSLSLASSLGYTRVRKTANS